MANLITEMDFDVVFVGRTAVLSTNEGLVVLLCDLIRALRTARVNVRVHTTDRHAYFVEKLLEANKISGARALLKVHKVGSHAMARKDSALARTDKARRPKQSFAGVLTRWGLGAAATVRRIYVWFLDGGGWPIGVRALAVLPILLLSVLVAFPLMLALAALVAAFAVRHLIRRTRDRLINLARRAHVPRTLRRIVHLGRRATRIVTSNLQADLYRREQARMAKALNRDVSVRALFFFTAFEGGIISKLSKRSLVVFPDAVTGLFPTRYADTSVSDQLRQIKESVLNATAIVCYSRFVEQTQLRALFGHELGSKSVHVIPQGYFAARDAAVLPSPAEVTERLNAEKGRLVNFFPTLLRGSPSVQFGSFDYVLYPTIDRPHKNSVTLARAVAILLRKRYQNIKLLMTTPSITKDLYAFLHSERLHYDVLFMPTVPPEVLDSLFQGAALTIHPSLAEGGDIFNFSRAVSNGCPALISDASMSREMFERDEIPYGQYKDWIFNPIDDVALANKIAAALQQRETLLTDQKVALQKLQKYDYNMMAQRYLNAFNELLA